MPIKTTKKTRKPRLNKKTTKKNNMKQNIKINISTSGGSGGGGTSVPNIPQPLQSFARSEKIGENVNVTNLLNRIGTQQTEAFNNFSNIINNSMRQRNQENEMLQQINRDDKIDIAEQVNDGINNNENIDDMEFVVSPRFPFFDEQIPKMENIPIVTPTPDKNTQTLFEKIKTQTEPIEPEETTYTEIKDVNFEPAPVQTTRKTLIETEDDQNLNFIGVGGGGGGSPERKIKPDTYITQAASGSYVFKPPKGYSIEGQAQKTYVNKEDAYKAREDFFKDNNIKYEIKK